ncbi:uncharacterized protein METZ01_LOCUS282849, partial [marine metagenome]
PTLVLGFSLTGSTVPAGEGTLVVIEISGSDEPSLSGIIVSDPAGADMGFTYDSGGPVADFTVNAGNMYFYPDAFNIEPGQTVEWYNSGGTHNVNGVSSAITGESFDNPEEFFLESVVGPATIGSFTFTIPGHYQYDCSLYSHAANGMVGSLTVGSGGCTDDMACNYASDADFDDGSCDYGTMCWDGSYECNANDCPDEPGGMVSINYNVDTPIAGFQFDVTGVTVTGVSGGAAEAAGFMISSSATTVLGFSLTGMTIPAGEGVLIVLDIEGNAGDACIEGVILSDAAGEAIDQSVEDCTTIIEGGGDDCPSGVYDCAGVCDGDAVEDCAGECGGSAEVDECGECGGPGADVMCEDGSYVCDASDCETSGWDGDACTMDVNSIHVTSSGSVLYNTDTPIAGFQFNVDGAT